MENDILDLEELDRQYQQLLESYTKIKDANKHAETQKIHLNESIKKYQEELRNIQQAQLQTQNNCHLQSTETLEELNADLQNLEAQLAQEQTKTHQFEKQKQIHQASLKESIEILKGQLSNLTSPRKNSNNSIHELGNFQTGIYQKSLQVAEDLLKSHQATLTAEEKENLSLIHQIQQAEHHHQNFIKTSNTDLKLKENQIHRLEKELANLQNECENQIRSKKTLAESANKQTHTQQNILNQENQNNRRIHSEIVQLESKLLSENQLIEKLQKQNEPLLQEIQKLEKENDQLNKKIDQISKQLINKKKQKEEVKKEQKKSKKGPKNYKYEIVEQEKEKEKLLKDIERENKRLLDVIELKKTYVSQQSLDILKRQFERNQQNKKPSLESQKVKLKKLQNQNTALKDRIAFLINADARNLKEKKDSLNEVRQKFDNLVNHKLLLQKSITLGNNKLNEYMKEYPDHEKQKEERKNQEKRRLQEEKDRKKQEEERERIKTRQGKRKNKDKITEENEDASDERLTDDPTRMIILPPRDQASIFNNKQFQMTCSVVAFFIILALIFM